MKALASEWVDKAEGDFHSSEREMRARRHAITTVPASILSNAWRNT